MNHCVLTGNLGDAVLTEQGRATTLETRPDGMRFQVLRCGVIVPCLAFRDLDLAGMATTTRPLLIRRQLRVRGIVRCGVSTVRLQPRT